MGRRAHHKALSLWANGVLVGHWTPAGRRPMELRYADGWLGHPSRRPLSLSLPLPLVGNEPLRGAAVENYFENLLPDSQAIRRRLAQRYAAGSEGTFELLAALGRDCVGALQILPDGESPVGYDRIQAKPLDDEAVAALLRDTLAAPLPGAHVDQADFRLSIAGAQEKTALLWHEGRWMRPLGATPTTHIIKMPMGLVGNMQADMSTSVFNEWLCLRLMHHLRLDVAHARIVTFADHPPVLVVERFDRRMDASGTWLMRLMQEDFCQACGVNPAGKYEADGGPGLLALAHILSGSQQARKDLRTLLTCQLVFWLLAATDGHAKNFSLRLEAGGAYRLTPVYDVLSAWPVIGPGKNQVPWQKAKLAMALRGRNRHYELSTIQRRHFNATAARCGWGESAEDIIGETLSRLEGAIQATLDELPADFPEGLAATIFEGAHTQARRLEGQPAG
jgi:serine/threonine-protein kinase HipA